MGRTDQTLAPSKEILAAAGLAVGKFYDWRKRYGEKNQPNGKVPQDFWLRDWEKQRILDFLALYLEAGYRRLTYMLLDADLVAFSPASVWRVLGQAGRLRQNTSSPSKKRNRV